LACFFVFAGQVNAMTLAFALLFDKNDGIS
jgi:hypothetical protein